MPTFVPLEKSAAVAALLAETSIFVGVTDPQRDAIIARLQVGLFHQGDFVFQKGDHPSHIYVVQSGSVELFFADNQAVIEKKRLGAGECLGQVALMSMHPHTISAVALEDSEIILLSRRALQQFLQDDIELFALLMMNLARELARRLQFTDELLVKSLHQYEAAKASDRLEGHAPSCP
jgi:CRP/FNR family cyclic AMP-dependent transcriptional regulator